MTKAEACLWKYALRNKKLKGYAFRRQRPVLNYIADFMCMHLMLIIEVDGITHWQEVIAAKDEVKEKTLIAAGFRVVRFDDREVLKDIENVIRELEAVVEGIEAEIVKNDLPPPTPASGGQFLCVPRWRGRKVYANKLFGGGKPRGTCG